jgi:uncharacterized lipoprotein NlpE involved in copper resistance
MKTMCLMLVAVLAGCGNASDAPSWRVAAGFVAAQPATQAAAPVATAVATRAAAPATRRAAVPAADAFDQQVRAVVATSAGGDEPAALGPVPASAPEDSEPAPL